MKNKRYNGWANYETWNVPLWIGNEEPLYRAMLDRRPFTATEAEAFAREIFPDGTPDFDDRGGAKAYELVNWGEVAEAWNEE
jgi:hypothetical protein